VLLLRLATQGIEVVVIDHDSEDETYLLLDRHRDDPVISVERLSYTGKFSLAEQFLAKRQGSRS